MSPFVLRVRAGVALLAMGGALAGGCIHNVERKLTTSDHVATLDAKSPYLKAHLRSGFVYVLSEWHADSQGAAVHGWGKLLDPNRRQVAEGEFWLPSDSVALYETNVLRNSGASAALTVMAGITAAVAGICASSPKTCFGSCPTFYAADSTVDVLQAEGFSASIAPALEATDVDMLYRARPTSRDVTLRVTNEALETHVIRIADLRAPLRPRGGRVFVTPEGVFRAATEITPPSFCEGDEGDCLPAVQAFDGRERTSLTDSTDLAARETIDLEFDRVPPGETGLVIASRQTLLTTYLIYQTLAYMGSEVGRWLTAIGTGGPEARERASGLGRALGRIEVLVPDRAAGWVRVGGVGETGPLAADTKVVPLPVPDGQPLRVRLRLTRGLWRIDYLALASLGDVVPPLRLRPRLVRRDGRDDPDALSALLDTTRALTTMPGDAYEFVYRLPDDFQRYELFLEAKGYYLEWMRREWAAEESQLQAARLVYDPAGALRALAPAYKRQEPSLERLFWSSRYGRH